MSGAIVLVEVLVLLVGYRFPGYDEAKYLGIGLNVLSANGARTVYGAFFPTHSPLWPVLMAMPQAWFGLDAYAWAHVLNAIAIALLIGAGAALAWPIRPAASMVTTALVLVSPVIFALALRTGLDIPAAALALCYLVVGADAVRRGEVRWAIGAGLIFAGAFLVKEVVAPLAPVPILAGLASGARVRVASRVGGWILFVFLVATAWWWLLYARETGMVWRLRTPAWTLLPIGIGLLVVSLAGVGGDRIASGFEAQRLRFQRAARRVPARRVLAWLAIVAWALLLAVIFSRAVELRGYGLLDVEQMRWHIARVGGDLRTYLVLGGLGAVIALIARLRSEMLRRPRMQLLWMATVAAVPFMLLVIGVGELPRHYVAQLVVIGAIASAGWLWLVGQADIDRRWRSLGVVVLVAAAAILAVPSRPRVLVIVLGLGSLGALVLVGAIRLRPELRRHLRALVHAARLPLAAALLSLVAASSFLTVGAATAPITRGDRSRSEAVTSATSWLRNNVAAGTTIAYGCCLANNVAVNLAGRNRAVQVREAQDVLFDPRAEIGLRSIALRGFEDWVAIFESPGNSRTFYGYSERRLLSNLRAAAGSWVFAGPDDAAPITLAARAFAPEHGFQTLAAWRPVVDGVGMRAFVLRFDPDRVRFRGRVYFTEEAMARFVGHLERAGPDGRRIATRLIDRMIVVDPGPRATDLFVRLRRLAGSGP